MTSRLRVPTSFTAGRRFVLGDQSYEPGDPVPSRDEVQVITLTGVRSGDTGGFTLTFSGQTTGSLSGATTASAVKSALVALSNVGAGQVAVTGPNGGPFSVRFEGTLSGQNVAQMTATNSMVGGGTPSVAVTTEDQGATATIDLKSLRNLSALISRRYLIPNQTLWGGRAITQRPTPSDLGPSGRKLLP